MHFNNSCKRPGKLHQKKNLNSRFLSPYLYVFHSQIPLSSPQPPKVSPRTPMSEPQKSGVSLTVISPRETRKHFHTAGVHVFQTTCQKCDKFGVDLTVVHCTAVGRWNLLIILGVQDGLARETSWSWPAISPPTSNVINGNENISRQ